jgi:hypothetical protein
VEEETSEALIHHLKNALSHLDEALKLTIKSLQDNKDSSNWLGKVWEEFLGTFFGRVRSFSKDYNINLLNLISFSKMRKF